MTTPTDRFLTGSSTGSFSTQSQHRFPVPSPTGTGTGATGSSTRTEPVEPLDPNPVNHYPKEHPVNSTTSTGTTITLEDHDGDRCVILTNPAAPADLRRTEAGRVIDGGFQPAPFAAWALSPEALRIIADVIEGAER